MTAGAALRIRSGQGDYSVELAKRIEDLPPRLLSVPRPLYIVDRRVAELYGNSLSRLWAGASPLLLEANEEAKTLEGVSRVLEWLQGAGADKKATVVALGGGVIQDIATFSSHVYHRGLSWVYVPTTLLGMADSCIGAKCGINFRNFKNQLGVFHSPAAVIVAPEFLSTLAESDVASGYGEMLKLMLTGSEEDFSRIKAAVESGMRAPGLETLILRSLEIKKGVIEQDEYELDRRRILNYGHTFGHALESVTRYEIPHGLAVAWGLDLINFIAFQRGLLQKAWFEAIHEFVAAHLPARLPRRISAAELLAAAGRDKKASGGRVHLVLLERPGRLNIVEATLDSLEEPLEAYLTQYALYRN